MKLLSTLLLLALSLTSTALPTSDSPYLTKRVDSTKVGYLGVYWTTADESVYFSLSNNANPAAFKKINGGKKIVSPTLGTKAIRDSSIISGGGADAGKKWYIIGTDLDISTTNWDKAQRTGSRGIFVWESTDLIKWTAERLVTVEDATAGMVWAPDAIWDAAKGQYLVHWASKFYAASDTGHAGAATTSAVLRYAHTSDFKTFTKPATYIDKKPNDVIDLALLRVNDNTFVRYYAEGGGALAEVSNNGLFGTWTRPAGIIQKPYEGPYAFWDNQVANKVWLLQDLVGGNAGVAAWSTMDYRTGKFTRDTSSDITYMRHPSVVAVTQKQYDALNALSG